MINKFINWFFSPTSKLILENNDLYSKLIELEQRIKVLEEENVETTNCLYENANSISAVDFRIDILAEHCGIIEDV